MTLLGVPFGTHSGILIPLQLPEMSPGDALGLLAGPAFFLQPRLSFVPVHQRIYRSRQGIVQPFPQCEGPVCLCGRP